MTKTLWHKLCEKLTILKNQHTKNYYSGDKAKEAKQHVRTMSRKYRTDIQRSVDKSIIYDEIEPQRAQGETKIKVLNTDTVSALIQEKHDKTALLNFASYYNPGGGYLWGTMAQEEALCSESTLYNVLSHKRFEMFYEENGKNVHNYLFTNRGIYTPHVNFERSNICTPADVITVAAPNRRRQASSTAEENSKALQERIDFILDIAQAQGVETLILGAFGCGVFGQNPIEVAQYFKDSLNTHHFNKVIFAIMPDKLNTNYLAFKNVFIG